MNKSINHRYIAKQVYNVLDDMMREYRNSPDSEKGDFKFNHILSGMEVFGEVIDDMIYDEYGVEKDSDDYKFIMELSIIIFDYEKVIKKAVKKARKKALKNK